MTLLAEGHNDKLCPTDSTAEGRLEEDQNATYSPTKADFWIDIPADLGALTGIKGKIHPLPGHTEGSLIVVLGDVAVVGGSVSG